MCGYKILHLSRSSIMRVIFRNVNGAGRVCAVVSPYPTRWINILSVPVLIFIGYLLYGYPHNILISTDIHGYPRVFTKK